MENENTKQNEDNAQTAEGDSVRTVVSSPNLMQEAWEKYHGASDDLDEIPAAPPSYIRGFVDGVDHERMNVAQRYSSELSNKRRNRLSRLARSLRDDGANQIADDLESII